MIYVVALVLSVVVCVQTFVMEVLVGNTRHVKAGRQPNAGVALLPIVPLYQLLELGLAWALERFVPNVAMVALLAIHAALFIVWAVSFRGAKADYSRALAASQRAAGTNLSQP